MARWHSQVATSNVFNTKARVEAVIPTPFHAGSDRMIPANIKVWPVKGKSLGRLWSAAGVTMAREFRAGNFFVIPNINKFSRFRELNKEGKQLYLITMFQTPKRDPADAEGVMTFGFIVDLNKTKPVSA